MNAGEYTPGPDETAVASGTRLLTPLEIAPRLGLTASRRGAETVRSWARGGSLPCIRPNARTYLFHWPTVVAQAGKVIHRGRRGAK